jgi:hypothetical protein
LGLTWNDSSRLQKVAEHKALIPEAVERAKETSDIPKNKLERIIRSSVRQPRSSALLNLAKSASLAKSIDPYVIKYFWSSFMGRTYNFCPTLSGDLDFFRYKNQS